jgi:hypothetical protein
MQLNSILNQVIQDVYNSKTMPEAKDHLIRLLDASKIKPTDKIKMIGELSKINTLTKLQFYATNALLKYEGLGVSL